MKLLEFYEYVSKNLFSNIYYIHRLWFFLNRCKSVEPFCEKRTFKIIVAVVEQWLCVVGSSLQSSLKHLSKNVHHIYKKEDKTTSVISIRSDKHVLDIWFSQYCWQNIYFFICICSSFWARIGYLFVTCKKSTVYLYPSVVHR